MKEKFIEWWNAECKTFRPFCEDGETFTHGGVILVHMWAVAVLLAAGIAELL